MQRSSGGQLVSGTEKRLLKENPNEDSDEQRERESLTRDIFVFTCREDKPNQGFSSGRQRLRLRFRLGVIATERRLISGV